MRIFPVLIVLFALVQAPPAVRAADAPASILPGRDLWAKEAGASACATPEQSFNQIGCDGLNAFEHVRYVGSGVYDGGLAHSNLPEDQRSYLVFARDDGTRVLTPAWQADRFFTTDPRTMAETDAAQSSGAGTNPYTGREFWRTAGFNEMNLCMTPLAAVRYSMSDCREMGPGTHWKILKAGILPGSGTQDASSDGYFLIRGDDDSYGYIKQLSLGIAEDAAQLSVLGIAWEDPKITATKAKSAEAAAKAACDHRGNVRIGMTQPEVLASCWGVPTKKIKTISAHATREKWVYSDAGAFLYFDNGKLVRIKESQ
ncbi:MAG TPA: hypothetical protein VHU23_19240 [Rhizomicrobium sp.]|jgi:hypothetical protein|nr:hypothetical protein [Rhizomicrobium sp.]